MAKVPVGPIYSKEPVRLYEVYNTAHRSLPVLALDERAATEIAYAANHVHNLGFFRKDRNYPHVAEVKRPLRGKFAECSQAIQEAIARRLQGTVRLNGGGITVGNELIEP